MNFSRIAARIVLSGILAASLVLAIAPNTRAQVGPRPRPQVSAIPTRPANLAAVAWLAGKWEGTAGKNTTEEICTQPTHALMTCIFRVSNATKMLWIELWSFYSKPEGLVAQVRFFHTDLEPLSPPAATYRLLVAGPDKLVYENTGAAGPRSLTMTHMNVNQFLSRVEVVGAGGKSTFLDNNMHRVP